MALVWQAKGKEGEEKAMDRARALEIYNSLGVMDVYHGGSPVWIEEINGDTARVRYLGTGRRAEVPLVELQESLT